MGNQGSLLKAPPPLIAAYLDDRKQLLITVSACALALWNAMTGDRKALISFTKKTCALYIQGRDELVLGEEDGTIVIFKASTARFMNAIKSAESAGLSPGERCIRSLASLPNDAICVGAADGSLRAYNLSNGEELWRIRNSASDGSAALCIASAADKQRLIVGHASGVLCLIDTSKAVVEVRLRGHAACITAVAFLGDSTHFASAGADNSLRLWDATSVLNVDMHSLHYDSAHEVLFAGDTSGNLHLLKRKAQLLEVVHTQPIAPDEAIINTWFDLASEKVIVATGDSHVALVLNPLKPISATSVAQPQVKGSDNATLRSEDVVNILNKYQAGDWRGDTDLNSIPLFRSTEKLASLSTQMFSAEEMAKFLQVLNVFKHAKADLENTMFLLNNELLTAQRALWSKYAASVDEEVGKREMQRRQEEQRAEMEERHKREKAQLEASFQQQQQQFQADLPRQRNIFAAQALQLRERYRADLHHNATSVVEAFRNLVFRSFPILSSRYKLGVAMDSTSGNVYSAFDLLTMEPVVVKAFASNVALNTTLSHPGLVPVQEVSVVEGTSFVIMKWMEKTLAQHAEKREFSFSEIAKIGASLLRVLAYLHSKRLVARDLCPKNIYVTPEGEAMLAHLGVMRPIGDERPVNGVVFSAPELFVHSLSTNSDLWSLGLVLLFLAQTPSERTEKPLVTSGFPFDVSTLRSIAELIGAPSTATIDQLCHERQISDDERPKLLALTHTPEAQRSITSVCAAVSLDEEFSNLLSRLLVFLPSQRMGAAEALSHAFFHKHLASTALSPPTSPSIS